MCKGAWHISTALYKTTVAVSADRRGVQIVVGLLHRLAAKKDLQTLQTQYGSVGLASFLRHALHCDVIVSHNAHWYITAMSWVMPALRVSCKSCYVSHPSAFCRVVHHAAIAYKMQLKSSKHCRKTIPLEKQQFFACRTARASSDLLPFAHCMGCRGFCAC